MPCEKVTFKAAFESVKHRENQISTVDVWQPANRYEHGSGVGVVSLPFEGRL